MTTCWTTVPTPVGDLLLTSDGRALSRVLFDGTPEPDWEERRDDVLVTAVEQLGEYFAGERTDFDLPLAPAGTPFQLRVWEALRSIPYAETRSYGHLAAQVGQPSASRAVGAANGRNPLPIVVPCHRVIGADGRLTGFGGGLPRKEWLLSMERGQSQMALDGPTVSA
jgi:methylated-DNA-[protein]-cysteine S-methyltransferase